MKYYIRFGDFPKDGKSKYHKSDMIVKEEKGISVWNCVEANDVYFPILPHNPTEECIADYFYMILGNKPVYLVEGIELAEKGYVGEPLLQSFKIVRNMTEDYTYLKKILNR